MEIRIVTALRDVGPKKVDSTTITIELIYHISGVSYIMPLY